MNSAEQELRPYRRPHIEWTIGSGATQPVVELTLAEEAELDAEQLEQAKQALSARPVYDEFRE